MESESGSERAPEAVLGVILAGGLSSRMGREKTFVELGGRPLLAHVIERFGPQVDRLALNANGDPARFAPFGLPVEPDRHGENPGPLAGVAVAIALARRDGYSVVATCPSDAPFLPLDAVARLRDALTAEVDVAIAGGPNGLEPLFGLWRIRAGAAVEAALAEGRRAVHRVLAGLAHRIVAFPAGDGPDPFSNLNTPEELSAAQALLASQ
jgi:molybdenum cofactor guanylyltransferase